LSLDRLAAASFGGGIASATPPPSTRWEICIGSSGSGQVGAVTFRELLVQAHCAWDVFVKDASCAEEQAADYPAIRRDTRTSTARLSEGRLLQRPHVRPDAREVPAEAVGERGSGKWERISWEQALSEIADLMVDTVTTEGPTASCGRSAAVHLRHPCRRADSSQHAARHLHPRHELGDRRLAPAPPSPSQDRRRAIAGRLLLLRRHPDLGCNPLYTQIRTPTSGRRRVTRACTSSRSPPTTTPRRSTPTSGSPSPRAPTRPSPCQCAVIVSEKLHNERSCASKPTCPSWCAATAALPAAERRGQDGSTDVLYGTTRGQEGRRSAARHTHLGRDRTALEGSYEARTLKGPCRCSRVRAVAAQLDGAYTPEQTAGHRRQCHRDA